MLAGGQPPCTKKTASTFDLRKVCTIDETCVPFLHWCAASSPFLFFSQGHAHPQRCCCTWKACPEGDSWKWGYWCDSEGKSRGPWPAWKSMIRAPLWQVAGKSRPASLKIPNVQKLLGQEPTKSRVDPPAAGVTGDFKTVEQQDPLLAGQTMTIKAT